MLFLFTAYFTLVSGCKIKYFFRKHQIFFSYIISRNMLSSVQQHVA